jgi:hypothetical protein
MKPAGSGWMDRFLKASGPEEDMKLYSLSMCVRISDRQMIWERKKLVTKKGAVEVFAVKLNP